jgi:3-oxoacyl-[acyl-carrier protein] reductase
MSIVLITGGASGLGNYLVKSYLKEGYNVIFTYNSSIPNYVELNSISNNYLAIKCDLTNEDDISNLISESYTKYSNIDILINNAAYESNIEFDNKNKKDFIHTLEVNLIAPFLLSKEIGRRMYQNKKGIIINISSDNSIDKSDPITLEYDASKAALNSLTHNLAKEFSPYVRVNAIAPNWIKTKKIEDLDKSLDGKFLEEEKHNNLLDRIATEEEISNLVMFLSSDKSSYINSEIIRIDGGNK